MSDYITNKNCSQTFGKQFDETGQSLPKRRNYYLKVGKPIVDRVLALTFGLIALPIMAISCLLVGLDGHSPLYSQARVGQNGRHFRMWKIRTMVKEADKRLAEYLEDNAEARDEWALYQKLRKDPRITRVGKVLRKASLDELPQFWNVLVGDMSIVGPRPMMVGQEALYPGQSYYSLKPGVTGPWQVSDRNDTSFSDRARYDESYLSSVSPVTDIKLIAATLRTVVHGSGC